MSVNIDKHVETFAANLIAASRFDFTSVGSYGITRLSPLQHLTIIFRS